MSEGYIHGGTDAREVARLEKQARWCAPFLMKRFDAKPGMRVLDLATGVGATAGTLLERYGGIRLIGIDLSAAQLQTAHRNHPSVSYVRGNGAALPFTSGAFDRVYCSWLLEHVSAQVAVQILREVRRVLAPGGYCHFTEVDNSTLGTTPELPRVMHALKSLNDGQVRHGGDPFIGPKLEGYFKAAGFTRVDSRINPLRGDRGDDVNFQGLIDEFAEIFEGLDETLSDEFPELKAAAEDLRSLMRTPGATMRYDSTTIQGFV